MKNLSRREFISSAAKGAVVLGISGLDVLAKEPSLVKAYFNYKTTLGNDELRDAIAYYSIMADHYENMANYFSGSGSLSIPEDAFIKLSKQQTLDCVIDKNQTGSGMYKRTISTNERWDDEKGMYIVTKFTEFDLPRYTMKQDETLKSIVDKVTNGYPTKEEKAQALLCFVQTAIGYDDEKVEAINKGRDYVRNPKKTLLDKKGCCKDTSVLYASLLAQMDVDPAFIFYDHHVNVGVPLDFEANKIKVCNTGLDGKTQYKGTTYYVAETTPEVPMFIGKLMHAQIGKEIRRVSPALRR